MLGEKIRRQPHHDFAIFEHVGDAGWRAQIIFQHIKIIRVDTDDIDASDLHIDIVRDFEALHHWQIERVAEDDVRRNATAFEDFLCAVNIGEKHVERVDALEETGLQPRPFGTADHARHDIEGDQPFGRILAAIDRERNADPAEQKLRLRPPRREMFG